MKPNQVIDLTAAIENAAEITDLSATSVTQCAKRCESLCEIVSCDSAAASSPVTQCAKNCDIVITCDADGDPNPPVTQCAKDCVVVACGGNSPATFNCDVVRPN